MKKFTYLLLLLFYIIGGVMNAQGITGFTKAAEMKTLPANLTTGYYLIKEVNPQATGKPGGYLKAASEAANAVVTPKGKEQKYDGSNALELWYIEVDGETFTIATANKKAAWQAPNLNQKNLVAYANKANLTKTTESVTLDNKTATPTVGSCIIQNDAKSACVHYTGNNLGSWTDANPASVMMFEFYEVKEADLTKTSTAQVTYTYRLEGATKTYTKTIEQAVGENYEAPAFTEVDFVTFTQPQGTVQATGNNVDVTCTENLPFQKTTDLQSPKWVSINMHNWDSYGYKLFWTCEGPNQDIHAKKKEYNYELLKDDAYLWCIYGNAFDGFEIYNKKVGTDKSLNTANTTTGNAQITEDTEHTKWFVVNSKADNGKPCFTADRVNYLNAQFEQGGSTDATLKTWTVADGGSTCRIFAPSDWVLTKAEKVASIPTGAVGGYTNDEVIDTPLTEYEKDLFNISNAIALGDAIAQLTPNGVTLEAGKYYRLQSKHYTSRYANADMTGAENMKKAISSVVLFEATETENQYRLKMQGLGLGHATTSTPITLTSETNNMGSYKAVDKGEALFALKDATSSTAQYSALHDAASQSHKLVGWEENAEASQWYIIPATDVEVALNTAGNASYATTYLPFSVSNVEGATAYIGKKVNESTLQATAIKAGIPANTGVILKGAANEAKAVLTLGEAKSDVKENALKGTLVEKDYTNELVFGVNNENKVGFYSMAEGSKIGANKAYLATAATQAMKLVFDGGVTGIEKVMGEAANANALIYDLTGRHVTKVVKGGLYIQSGKKFIAQ